MAVHRFHLEHSASVGLVIVDGEEAHHAARVKRASAGERVEVLDGRGGIGRGVVEEVTKDRTGWKVMVRVVEVLRVDPVMPRLEVCSAVPKGARLSEMVDGLAQVGAAMWRPLETKRGVRESWRREKVERVAVEASKQCGRAWRMEVGDEISLADAVKRGAGLEVVLADAGGERYEPRGEQVRLLIGPEGGWSSGELEMAQRAGIRVCRFGVHTMRIETAAVVATGVVMGAVMGA